MPLACPLPTCSEPKLMTLSRVLLAIGCLWLGSVANATGQVPRVLKGRVLVDGTRRPLAGAEIVLMDLGSLARTDPAGVFQLTVPPPPYRIQVRRIGFLSRAYRIKNTADTLEVEFVLQPSAVQLESLSVIGKTEPISARLADFERRRRISATGQFLGLEELTKHGDYRLGDALRRLRGVRVIPSGSTGQTVVSMRGASGFSGDNCYLSVWLDGIQVSAPGRPYDLEIQRIDRLAAVEVYTGPADTPIEFESTGNSCGSLVLWTKER